MDLCVFIIHTSFDCNVLCVAKRAVLIVDRHFGTQPCAVCLLRVRLVFRFILTSNSAVASLFA